MKRSARLIVVGDQTANQEEFSNVRIQIAKDYIFDSRYPTHREESHETDAADELNQAHVNDQVFADLATDHLRHRLADLSDLFLVANPLHQNGHDDR